MNSWLVSSSAHSSKKYTQQFVTSINKESRKNKAMNVDFYMWLAVRVGFPSHGTSLLYHRSMSNMNQMFILCFYVCYLYLSFFLSIFLPSFFSITKLTLTSYQMSLVERYIAIEKGFSHESFSYHHSSQKSAEVSFALHSFNPSPYWTLSIQFLFSSVYI